MVKTTFKQLEKLFISVYMASDFYLTSIWTIWNTALQRVQVNQCQFCVLKPRQISPFLPSSCSLFSTCLDCFMIFAPTRRESFIVFIKCSCLISLCFILCLVLIFWSGKPSWWNLLFARFSWTTWRSIKDVKLNSKHNPWCLNFYSCKISSNNFDLC